MASLRPGAVHPPGQGNSTRSQRSNGGIFQGPDYGRVPRRDLGHARAPTTTSSSSSLQASTRIPSAASRTLQTAPTVFAPTSTPRRSPDDRIPRSHTHPPVSHQKQQPRTAVGGSSTSGPSNYHAVAPAFYDASKRYPMKNTPADGCSASTNSVQRGRVSGVRPHQSNPGESRSTSSSARTRTQTSPSQDMDRGLTASPAELHQIVKKAQVTIYPELDRYRNTQAFPPASDDRGNVHPDILFRLATQNLPPPPTPLFSGSNSLVSAMSGSPSTRFSESPGTGPYSRDTTPTSISSHSPGLVASSARMPAPRVRQIPGTNTGSFGKDSISKEAGMAGVGPSATHTLAAIRESLNSSSSSNGTVCAGEKREKTKKKRMTPPPPSPPPRKSSQKFKRLGDDDQGSPSKPKQPSSRPTQSSKVSPPAELTLPSRKEPTSSKAPANAASPPPTAHARALASPPLSTSTQQRRTAVSPQLTQRPTPPTRPSRDGTPDLQSQMGFALPVIQSNLTFTSLSNRRTSLHAATSSPPGRGQQLSLQEKQASKQGNSGETAGLSSTASASTSNIPVTTQTHSSQESWDDKESGRVPRSVSPGVSTFRTRFPLFGRRAKTVTSPDGSALAVETREKLARKGPSAGTGYEGYGRPGHIRRKSSSVSDFFRSGGAASSQDSLHAGDAFLRNRMSPVVIAGGEVVQNHNIPDLELSTDRRPSTDSRNGSEVSLSSRDGRTALWPSALEHGQQPASLQSSRNRRPSDSSDSEAVMRSTLAYRRSVQRFRSPDQAQVRVPCPIVVRPSASGVNLSMSSLDTSVLSDDSAILETKRGRKGSFSAAGSSSTGKKKLAKRARSPRKWNLFGRAHSQPTTAKTGLASASMVTVTVEAALPQEKPKAVAFYAMLDSSEQEEGNLDVEAVLREARVLGSPAEPSTWGGGDGHEREPSSGQTRSPKTMQLLPPLQLKSAQQSQPRRRSSSSSRGRNSEEQQQQQQQQKRQHLSPSGRSTHAPSQMLSTITQIGRPNRLAQVGRIPKVVSARPEQTSPKSFSRPFNHVSTQLSTPSPQPGSVNGEWIAKGPSPKMATPELVLDGSTTTGSSVEPHHLAQDVEGVDHGNMFLSFSPRKNSQSTSYTSSSGPVSFADATAVVPDPSAPLVEDEIWDEYNDLFGDVAAKPASTGPSAKHARPAILTRLNQVAAADTSIMAESPTITPHYQALRRSLGNRPPVASSVYSTDMAAEVKDMIEAGQNQLPPTSASVTDLMSGHGNRNNLARALAKPLTTASRRSSASSQKINRQTARVSDGSVYSQVSDDSSPLSQVNLRVGSMTVSKWLTFGHVLFSPARDDMVPAVRPPNGHAVLVLDGLGNDDWSFYAAETYPAVTFFNLSPRAPLLVPDQQTDAVAAFPRNPQNHHQIQYTSYADKLPFQAEIFTTVVLRFPASAPEAHYKNIIQEARRVLKPGGYLELSILDLDLNNMGPRTRRAIRQLKEQIRAQTPDMHLGSAADVVLRLLGTRGFLDIKTCRVGIPVASTISQTSSEANVNGVPVNDKPKKKDQRSLAEMMSDQSPVADESITHMVAKVGRWWHSRCYGDAALEPSARPANSATGSRGLWLDRAVLAECEEWRTNLKLMVCYARVPESKRVASI